nr:GDSL esterase/lipase LIP-4-like [Ipomoea batatas]
MLDGDDFGNVLYMIDIGQNDITNTFINSSIFHVLQQIPTFIYEIKDAIKTLYKLGRRKFWVYNTGPASCLPRMLTTNKVEDHRVDFGETSCVKPLSEVVQDFNAQLQNLCQDLRVELKNATMVYVDMYTIKCELISNFTLYGFDNPLMPCCGNGGTLQRQPQHIVWACGANGFTVCVENTRYIS